MGLDTYTPLAYTWGDSFKRQQEMVIIETSILIKVLKQIVEQEYP